MKRCFYKQETDFHRQDIIGENIVQNLDGKEVLFLRNWFQSLLNATSQCFKIHPLICKVDTTLLESPESSLTYPSVLGK